MSEILLGIGGGIAAYKSCDLLRQGDQRELPKLPYQRNLNLKVLEQLLLDGRDLAIA